MRHDAEMVSMTGTVDMAITFTTNRANGPLVSGQRMTGTPTEVAARLEDLAGRLRDIDATRTTSRVGSSMRPLILVVGNSRDTCRRTARARLGRDIDGDPANADIFAVTTHVDALHELSKFDALSKLDATIFPRPHVAVILSDPDTFTRRLESVVDTYAAHSYADALSIGQLLTDAAPWPSDLTGTGIGML